MSSAQTPPRRGGFFFKMIPDMIVNRQRRMRLPLGEIGRFARRARRELHEPRTSRSFGRGERSAFTVCLMDDKAMRALNARFRGRRKATDVLSFPSGSRGNRFLGEIAISVETARKNARREGHSLLEEIKLLILHGLLHLLGYDHETDKGRMTRKELRLRRRMGLT